MSNSKILSLLLLCSSTVMQPSSPTVALGPTIACGGTLLFFRRAFCLYSRANRIAYSHCIPARECSDGWSLRQARGFNNKSSRQPIIKIAASKLLLFVQIHKINLIAKLEIILALAFKDHFRGNVHLLVQFDFPYECIFIL